jgi:hypothetical protein
MKTREEFWTMSDQVAFFTSMVSSLGAAASAAIAWLLWKSTEKLRETAEAQRNAAERQADAAASQALAAEKQSVSAELAFSDHVQVRLSSAWSIFYGDDLRKARDGAFLLYNEIANNEKGLRNTIVKFWIYDMRPVQHEDGWSSFSDHTPLLELKNYNVAAFRARTLEDPQRHLQDGVVPFDHLCFWISHLIQFYVYLYSVIPDNLKENRVFLKGIADRYFFGHWWYLFSKIAESCEAELPDGAYRLLSWIPILREFAEKSDSEPIEIYFHGQPISSAP